jgi:hypothetical protein
MHDAVRCDTSDRQSFQIRHNGDKRSRSSQLPEMEYVVSGSQINCRKISRELVS